MTAGTARCLLTSRSRCTALTGKARSGEIAAAPRWVTEESWSSQRHFAQSLSLQMSKLRPTWVGVQEEAKNHPEN